MFAAGVLSVALARAEPPPVRIDYQSAEGCPGEAVFLDEIRWRTARLHVAAVAEDALEVRARITRRGAISSGRLTLGMGKDRITREIVSESCDEVVSALALVTALAVDPEAATQRRPPPVAPSPPPPSSGLPAPPEPARPPLPFPLPEPPPWIVAEPLPVLLFTAGAALPPRAGAWIAGVRATAAFAITPRPLFGGGLFVERAFAPRWGGALRLALEVGATGAIDVPRGGAWFLRGLARAEVCVFAVRPARWLSIVPCVAAEGGALHGQGIASETIIPKQATVPWVGPGVLPHVTVDIGAAVLEVQGGAIFPLIQRDFTFRGPPTTTTIYTLPPVTGLVSLGGGARFP